MAKPDPSTTRSDRFQSRELMIVAAIVGLFILVGALYTLFNGPQPAPGAGGTISGVEAEVTPSGALRPADEGR
jgi:hypothetical protein